jgi:uncharacterized protein (DUF2141 family)
MHLFTNLPGSIRTPNIRTPNICTLIKPLGLSLLALSASLIPANLIQPAAIAQIPASGSLTAEVTGLKNASGQVCFSLFNRSEGFPNDPEAMVATQCVSATPSEEIAPSLETTEITETAETAETAETTAAVTPASPTVFSVTFAELALGTYAVSVLHDENQDNQLNTGSFGIPTEGFGFSKNPTIQTGAPDFNEAAVIVTGPNSKTEIELIYF